MNLGITFRSIESSDEAIEYIKHRFSFAFARTEHEIDEAKVTVSDINGPKGGLDMQCQIVVTANGLRPLVVSERREDLRQAIDRCLYRASQSLSRKLKRRQALLKKTRPTEMHSAS